MKNIIKNKLLIVPGYIIGLCCLLIVTYRTIIAFFSANKAVIIYINRFGEQFMDIFALVIIWIICIAGLIILFMILKEEKSRKKSGFNYDKKPLIAQHTSFFYTNKEINVKIDKMETMEFLQESSKSIDQELIIED